LKSAASQAEFCMAGYVLKNTMTENGSVSRGVCETDSEGFLHGITERTGIQRQSRGVCYADGEKTAPLDEHATVSMNCWGFTPLLLAEIEKRFPRFFAQFRENLQKAEFYLPFVVNEMVAEGLCTVKVLPVTEQWFGVTYQEDKPFVVQAIHQKVQDGIYPERLSIS